MRDDNKLRETAQNIIDGVFETVRERAVWAANNIPEHVTARDALLAFAACLRRNA